MGMFADAISEAIKAKGTTVYAVARAAQVDPAHLARFIRGDRDMRSRVIDRVLAVLDIGIEYAITPIEPVLTNIKVEPAIMASLVGPPVTMSRPQLSPHMKAKLAKG